ncbi:hypothetical protein THIOSC15_490002 [uncultured Thiomicrorhabdus sp.]
MPCPIRGDAFSDGAEIKFMTTHSDQIFQYGGMPVGGEMTTGDVYFVSSVTGSDGNLGKKPSQPFATLDKATNSCTANKNDIVYIMPNHAETISGTTTWVPDVAGVRYIGIGLGADAPELTFSATSSLLTISGGNNIISNVRVVAGISAIVVGVRIGADHVTLDRCTWDFSTTDFDFLTMLDIDAFDYCTVQNCRFIAENATAGANAAIRVDDTHHTVIRNIIITGDYAVGAINNYGTDALGNALMVVDNLIYNDDTASTYGGAIHLANAFTGMIARNMITHLNADDLGLCIDPGSCQMFENYVAEAVDKYGIATGCGTAATAA